VNARRRSGVLWAAGLTLFSAVPLVLWGAAATAPASKPDATTAACQGCHGAHGEGMPAAHVPRIAGQTAAYLKKQLDNYADGTRDNPIMVNFAKPLSEKQREDLAARFAAMSAPFVAQAVSATRRLSHAAINWRTKATKPSVCKPATIVTVLTVSVCRARLLTWLDNRPSTSVAPSKRGMTGHARMTQVS
jgi:cytochrome c553